MAICVLLERAVLTVCIGCSILGMPALYSSVVSTEPNARRFDDTNPDAEEKVYFEAIEEIVRWLGACTPRHTGNELL